MALPITVPYTFGTATTAIPLSNLDSDYATVYQAVNGIGNGSVALANVQVTGVGTTFPNNYLANSSVTIGNTAVALGSTVTSFGNVTLTNATISSVSAVLTPAQGGTGVNNSTNTITVAGNLSHTGAFTQTIAATANTSVTLPTSGTIISSVTALPGAVTGTPSSTSYLRGDGTWATVSSGSGTVNSGTAYQLAYYASTGTAVSTLGSLGTSGQVLTSGGAGVAPSWATPSAGAMTLISTQTASNSASLAWTGLSCYDKYILIIENLIPASASYFGISIGYGSTPTYLTSGFYGATIWGQNTSTTSGVNTNTNSSYISVASNPSVNTSYGVSASYTFNNLIRNPSQGTSISGTATHYGSDNNYYTSIPSGIMIGNSNSITAIKILAYSANIASGTASLYGITS